MRAAEGELGGDRLGVGIMLLNRDGLAFVGHRIRMPAGLAKWQMPQGGIDTGETPCQAALRELKEEVGTGRADILAVQAQEINAVLPLIDFKVRLLDANIAQTTYISVVTYDEVEERGLRSSIWSRSPTGWQLRFHQGTPINL